MAVQQYIAGLLLVSTLCAAALSHPPHPYTAEFPKRILLSSTWRDVTTLARYISSPHSCCTL